VGSTRGIRAGKAFVELYADNSRLVRGLRQASRRIKAFGANVQALGLKMAGLGTMAVAPMALASKAFSSMGDSVAKMSKRTGVAVETLSELRFVASQTGTEFATLENAFRKMQRSIYDAGRGLSTQTEALADLGLEFKHLDGLLPIDQFKLLADRIGKVEDPTKKAAIAMSLMGRTGTNLLPMFAQGAAGIEKLQQEARRLGLTMSAEDAKAAEDFTDAMDKLGKVLKMGVFRVGAAMAKKLESLAERIADVGKRVGEWVDKNRGMIVTVAKIVAGVTVAGIAIAATGAIIGGLGTLLGVVVTTLKAIPIVLAAITSPMALVGVAAASMGAALAVHTNKGEKAIGSLAEKFISLKDDAAKSWEGISAALAKGDVAGAANIFWLTLKLAWQKGVEAIKLIWYDLETWLTKAWYGLVGIAQKAWHGIEVAWIETISFLQKAWAKFTNWHAATTESVAKAMAKTWAWMKSKVDDSFDLEFAYKYIDEDSDAATKKRDAAHNDKMKKLEDDRLAEREKSRKAHEETLAAIEDDKEQKLGEMEKEKTKKVDAINAELIAAKKALQDAINDAKSGESPFAQFRLKNMKDEIGDGLDSIMGKVAMSVKGTFSAEAIAGLGVGDNKMDKLVATGEQTAANTKTIAREARNGGMVFT